MPYLIGAAPGSTQQWGSKAANLHRLWRQGFRVPPGFVLLAGESIPERNVLENLIRSIGGFPIAVRSSAIGEDGSTFSFAGQFESVLNIKSLEDFYSAVAAVRASVTNERAIQYRDSVSDSESGTEMNVLVQPMISAIYSGVCFTMNPTNGFEEEFVVELCTGLGDKLVSGKVAPLQYIYNWQTKQVVHSPPDSESQIATHLLERIVQIGLKIQAEFKHPQDIEFCIGEDQQVWVLQSRPITSYQPRKDTDDLTTADFRDGGVSARACTPLMASIYGKHFSQSMQNYAVRIGLLEAKKRVDRPLSWFQTYYGRPYWNASTVKKLMSKVPGFDERSFDEDLGIVKEYAETENLRLPMNPKTVFRGLKQFLLLEREFRRNISRLSRLKDDMDEWIDDNFEMLHSLSDLEDHQFSEFFLDFFENLVHFPFVQV